MDLWSLITNKRRYIVTTYALIILYRKGKLGMNIPTLLIIIGPALYISYIAMVNPVDLNIFKPTYSGKDYPYTRDDLLDDIFRTLTLRDLNEKLLFVFLPVYLIIQYIMWGDKLVVFYQYFLQYVQSLGKKIKQQL